jgi:hypothetical protein
MYIYTFLLRMADTMISQNIDLSSWDTLSIELIQLLLNLLITVNRPYKGVIRGEASVIADVHYNRVKGYSRECAIGYIANTHNKHRNTQCDSVKVFKLGLFLILNSFLTTKPS